MFDGKNFCCDYCGNIFDKKQHPFLKGITPGRRWNGEKILTGIFCNEEHKRLYEEQFKVEDNIYKIGNLYYPYFESVYAFKTIEECRERNNQKHIAYVDLDEYTGYWSVYID